MEAEIKARLLASMNAGRLLIVCGAGLSMAPPSGLPSALRVAEICFDKYKLETDPSCDNALRGDLEALASYFAGIGTLDSVFIDSLVPWAEFIRPPNSGHAALADFLITRAAVASISANYDNLIERCAWSFGADFRGALDGDEAILDAVERGPLLKFHGCATRDKRATVWAPSQLVEGAIAARIQKSKVWMAGNLRQKDLLVVGFWSDWTYLNSIIDSALGNLDPSSVTLVDLAAEDDLEEKAPELWQIAHSQGVTFTHVRESGADVLDELRAAFSQNYIRQFLDAGRNAFKDQTGTACDARHFDDLGLSSEDLYGWRRDAEGVPATSPATMIKPQNVELLGLFHLLLRDAGANQNPMGYEINGRTVRVLNGAGAVLNTIRSKFCEPPSLPVADLVVAVGATDLGVPGNVIRSGRGSDIVRPGATAQWYDLPSARQELNI